MVATIQLVTLSALTLTHLPAMDYMVWLPSCPVFGSGGWARTSDPMINSHLLYQLSYAEIIGAQGETRTHLIQICNLVPRLFSLLCIGTPYQTRTGTSKGKRILSPQRLPFPPRER